MAGYLKLVYSEPFTSTDTIQVTHNTDVEYLAVKVVIGTLSRQDLIDDIRIDPADPRNKLTVVLSSSQTGIVQIFTEDAMQINLRPASRDNELVIVSGTLQTQIDDKPDTLLELEDTPDTYSRGLYLKSTSSGTEWATASGGGGTSYHSELDELDYASSGHTGFASSVELSTTSGTLQDQLDSLDYYTTAEVDTISGTLYDEIYTVSGSLQYEIDTLTHLDLTDTPTTYSGGANKLVTVNEEEDGLYYEYFEWDPQGPLIPETAISGTYFINFEGGRLLIGATGNKPDLVYNGPVAGLAFDAAKVESCYGVFKIPFAWNTETDIIATVNFMTDDIQTGSRTCAWHIDYHTYEEGEIYADKTTTTVDIHADIPYDAAAGKYLVEELIVPYDDINNPVARGNMVTFRFYRDGTADTMTGDSILLALMFELQVGQNIAGG